MLLKTVLWWLGIHLTRMMEYSFNGYGGVRPGMLHTGPLREALPPRRRNLGFSTSLAMTVVSRRYAEVYSRLMAWCSSNMACAAWSMRGRHRFSSFFRRKITAAHHPRILP